MLKAAGLITDERKGTTLIYRVNVSVLEDAIAGLMDLFKIGEAGIATVNHAQTAPTPAVTAHPGKEKP